jgi:hypothetical protein
MNFSLADLSAPPAAAAVKRARREAEPAEPPSAAQSSQSGATGPSADIRALVDALAKLSTAEARLALQSAKGLREVQGITNWNVIIPSDHQLVSTMAAATAAYNKRTFKNSGHGLGAEHMWCWRALVLFFAEAMPTADEQKLFRDHLAAHGDLADPSRFFGLVSVCRCRECFTEGTGHRLELALGDKARHLIPPIEKFVLAIPNTRPCPGIAPRSGAERACQRELDRVQDLLKARRK